MSDAKQADSANTVFVLTDKDKAHIDHWIAKFPEGKQRSAILPALHILQDHHEGYLTDAMMDAVAEYLDVPAIQVYEVASFYVMYDRKKIGKNKLYVCTNIACQLRGADKIVEHLKKTLKINIGETTKDGLFTLKEFECLGACIGAPMMQVNKEYHENLTTDKVDKIIADCKKGA